MKKKILINQEELEVEIKSWDGNFLEFELEGERHFFRVDNDVLEFGGERFDFHVSNVIPSDYKHVFVGALEASVSLPGKVKKASGSHAGAGSLQSPMPGKIFKVLKEQGQTVKAGEPILILEAMKMEHTIKAQQDGTVKVIHYKEGAQVQGGVELCEIE